jgi:hypothetical protein
VVFDGRGLEQVVFFLRIVFSWEKGGEAFGVGRQDRMYSGGCDLTKRPAETTIVCDIEKRPVLSRAVLFEEEGCSEEARWTRAEACLVRNVSRHRLWIEFPTPRRC